MYRKTFIYLYFKGTCDLPMSFKLQAIAIRQDFNFRGYIKYKTLHTQTTLNAAIFACWLLLMLLRLRLVNRQFFLICFVDLWKFSPSFSNWTQFFVNAAAAVVLRLPSLVANNLLAIKITKEPTTAQHSTRKCRWIFSLLLSSSLEVFLNSWKCAHDFIIKISLFIMWQFSDLFAFMHFICVLPLFNSSSNEIFSFFCEWINLEVFW